jgi:anti-sigma-K factor RskA
LKGSPQQLQNPIEQIQTRYKHFENGFKLWLEQGKQGAKVLNASPQEEIRDPVERIQIQFQTRYKQLENGFNLWLSKQSIAVEAAAVTATTAAKWFAVGALATPFVFIMPWDVSDVSFKNMTPAHQVRVSLNFLI